MLDALRILHRLLDQLVVLSLFRTILNTSPQSYAVRSIEGGRLSALSRTGTSCSNRLQIVSIISVSSIQMQHPPSFVNFVLWQFIVLLRFRWHVWYHTFSGNRPTRLKQIPMALARPTLPMRWRYDSTLSGSVIFTTNGISFTSIPRAATSVQIRIRASPSLNAYTR